MVKEGGTVAKKVHHVGSICKCHFSPEAPDLTLNNDYRISEGTYVVIL